MGDIFFWIIVQVLSLFIHRIYKFIVPFFNPYIMTEDEHTPLIIDKVSNLLAYLLELKEKWKFQEAVDLIDETL